ncbi:WecB/TagA/CpsF family glycosyltransferase [Candidatus Peregrinibacteria bacterium]|nr:WecB/TagA/CpsF family glycosyltransferase [Candidatus Peregrinibacteria bacterium]
MSRVTILGIPVDSVTQEEAVRTLHRFLDEGRAQHVMTPNGEMLTEAARNSVFHAVLRRSALNLPDSVGLLWMARWTGQKIAERVTGVDTVVQLCERLDGCCPVFLLGGAEGVGGRAAETLCARNPRLRVVGITAGSPREEDVGEILRRINEAKPRLLLVAFGAPQQDLWIDRYLSAMPSVRVAMGIGGTLDFLAGVQKRAPFAMQRLGLEWLWRLMREPSRFRRIWNATVIFPWLVMKYGRGNPKSEYRNPKQ